MSILKSEVKIGTVHEIGCRLDDSLDAATQEMYKGEGAAEALHQAKAAFEKFAKNVDDEIKSGISDLESARFVKRYIGLMLNTLSSMERAAEGTKMANVGRVHAFKQAVQIAKQMKDEELSKLQLLQTALQKGVVQHDDGTFTKIPATELVPPTVPFIDANEKNSVLSTDVNEKKPDRPESTHPGMSLKQQRLAEASVTQVVSPAIEQTSEPLASKSKGKRNKK